MPEQAVHGGVIVSVDSYDEAVRAVRVLRRYGTAAADLSIVGAELRMAPKRQPVGRTAATGAISGGVLGMLAGVFVTLVAEPTMSAFATVFWGLVYGLLTGALWGFFRGLVHNRPDADSTEVLPTRFEVRCPADYVTVARRLLTSELAGKRLADAA